MTEGLESVPAYIRDALTPQMRRVVGHQLARAAGDGGCRGDAARVEARDCGRGVDDTLRTGEESAGRFEAMRADYRDERAFWNEGGPRPAETREASIRTAGIDVPIRIHRPVEAEVLPAIVYFHGGGFNVGDLDTHDRIMRMLADRSGAAVVGVDYTLSPEARFPQALYECAGVVAHLATDGARYGIDSAKLAVAGDSAGAMLSMGSVLLLRDEPGTLREVPAGGEKAFGSVKSMLLFYGGHGLRDSASSRLYGGFWDGMSPEDLGDVHTFYFNDPAERSSPLVDHLSADLASQLPAAYIVGAELDPLADDGQALATLLERCGQDVRHRLVPGVLHAFLHFGRMLDAANEELERGAEFARARF